MFESRAQADAVGQQCGGTGWEFREGDGDHLDVAVESGLGEFENFAFGPEDFEVDAREDAGGRHRSGGRRFASGWVGMILVLPPHGGRVRMAEDDGLAPGPGLRRGLAPSVPVMLTGGFEQPQEWNVDGAESDVDFPQRWPQGQRSPQRVGCESRRADLAPEGGGVATKTVAGIEGGSFREPAIEIQRAGDAADDTDVVELVALVGWVRVAQRHREGHVGVGRCELLTEGVELLALGLDQVAGGAADPTAEKAEMAGLLHVPFATRTVDGLDRVVLADDCGGADREVDLAWADGLAEWVKVWIGGGHAEDEEEREQDPNRAGPSVGSGVHGRSVGVAFGGFQWVGTTQLFQQALDGWDCNGVCRRLPQPLFQFADSPPAFGV